MPRAVQALFYDGKASRAHHVSIARDNDTLIISGEAAMRIAVDQVRVAPRLGNTVRTLSLPGGASLHCRDNDAVDALFPEAGRHSRWIDWLERRWPAVLVSVAVIVVSAVALFRWGLPLLGDQVARHVPYEVEVVVGRQVSPILTRMGMTTTELPARRQAELQALFTELVEDLPYTHRYRMHLVSFRGLPNAFAAPGGDIYLTDELVNLLDDDEAIVAVMAHEIGHLHHRHAMRHITQSASAFLIISMAMGDASGVSVLGASVPAFLLNNHYSREFEREADRFAFELLAERGYPPRAFARAMLKLRASMPAESRLGNYMSTHPPTDERIQAAREAEK